MKARIDLMHVNPGVVHAMLGLERQVQKAGLDAMLLNIAARTVPGDYAPGSLAKADAAR